MSMLLEYSTLTPIGSCFPSLIAFFYSSWWRVQDVWCEALKEMSSGDEYQMTATVACAGVAFTVAGLTMLIGMFVCCCCKAPAPEEPVYVKPQPVMMTPQPVYAAPAPQPAMMMYPEVATDHALHLRLACSGTCLTPFDRRRSVDWTPVE